eukprot:364930-Chlamydomonas_euryale.AAC.6
MLWDPGGCAAGKFPGGQGGEGIITCPCVNLRVGLSEHALLRGCWGRDHVIHSNDISYMCAFNCHRSHPALSCGMPMVAVFSITLGTSRAIACVSLSLQTFRAPAYCIRPRLRSRCPTRGRPFSRSELACPSPPAIASDTAT